MRKCSTVAAIACTCFVLVTTLFCYEKGKSDTIEVTMSENFDFDSLTTTSLMFRFQLS